MGRTLLFLTLLLAATFPANAQTSGVITGFPDAADGATLLFEHNGATRRVPLAGVSAPPIDAYPFGTWAHLALRDAIANTEVTCRVLVEAATGICIAPGLGDLARWAVMNGFAVPDPGPAGDPYAADARDARSARRGIWGEVR